jgi:hypothetical protein
LLRLGRPCGDHPKKAEIGVELRNSGWFTFHDPDGNRLDVCEYGTEWLE